MKHALFLATLLILVGAGCSTTSNTTVDTNRPGSDITADHNTSGDYDREKEDTATNGGVTVGVGVGVDVSHSDENVMEVTVTGRNMSFDPKEIKVKKGQKVRVTFKNAQGFHDFVLDEFNVKTKQISAGQEEVVEFIADKTGTFEYYCSVGSHRQMGMTGKLIVE